MNTERGSQHPEHPEQSESKEINEYDFEQGVQEAVAQIEHLLDNQEHAVVAITGSGVNVGKSTLATKIQVALMRKDIPVKWCADMKMLTYRSDFPEPGGVLLLHAEYLPIGLAQDQDNELKTRAQRFGSNVSKIDLRILIYRPDTPFLEAEKKFGDIIIKNEQAKDKSAT
jgi:hypothetical protein